MRIHPISAILAAFALLSCEPGTERLDTGATTLTFEAVAEDASKTVLSGTSVVWSKTDAISLFDSGLKNNRFISTKQSGTRATFSGQALESDDYAALYPYTASASVSSGLVISGAALSSSQSAVEGGFADGVNLSAAFTESQDSLHFRNVCGLMSLKFKWGADAKTRTIAKATVRASGSRMAGTAKIGFDREDGTPYVSSISSYADSVTLSGALSAGKTYCAVVFPGTYSGLEIILTDSEGHRASFTNDALGSVNVARNSNHLIADITIGKDKEWSGEQTGGSDTEVNAKYGFFELPAIYDKDRNGQYDNNPDYYYAHHFFSNGSKVMRNYSVCFSASKHCALWAAAPRHSCYEGKSGRNDSYRVDPDIPAGIQFSSKSTGGGCNKGHLIGSAERTINVECNKQVFYYSNIAPQLSSGFNTGGGGWNLLEDWIDTIVPSDTLYEVVGCYFDTFTDGYGNKVTPKTISFGGRSDVAFPTMFYYAVLRKKTANISKTVAQCSASELQCAAFVRAHTNSLKGQKPSSREMMSIADLEKITGFTYFVNVPNAPKTTFKASDWGL